MLWFFLALGSAFALATSDALMKKFFSELPAMEMGFITLAFAAPWLVIPLLVAEQASPASLGDWLLIVALIPLEITALFLYMKAIRSSPLSLTVPFLAFTPVWMILVGWLVLGELPNLWGGLGILIVTAGAYILNLDSRRLGPLEPFKAILREPGSRMMLIVSAIFAVTASCGKKLALVFGPAYFGPMYFLILTLALGATLKVSGRLNMKHILSNPKWAVVAGLNKAAMVIMHFWAISLAPAAYMVSVKRISLVFAVIYGRLLFGETNLPNRLIGALVMFCGLLLITLWG